MKKGLLILSLMLSFIAACSNIRSYSAPTAEDLTVSPAKAASYNVQLGLIYLQGGDKIRAKQKLLLALKQEPSWPLSVEAMAYYYAGIGDVRNAENYYKKALRAAPNSGSVLNNYGVFLCDIGRFHDAQKYLLLAANDPHYLWTAAAYENVGLCAFKAKSYEEAKYFFHKALSQDPGRFTALYELAEIHYAQGDCKIASKYLDDYMSRHLPDAMTVDLKFKIAKHC